MEVEVINKKQNRPLREGWKRIYIGRPSILGNPFIIGKDGARGEVIDKYERWLKENIENGGKVYEEIGNIVNHLLDGFNVELECWCYPLPCHGEIIRKYVLEDDWLYK